MVNSSTGSAGPVGVFGKGCGETLFNAMKKRKSPSAAVPTVDPFHYMLDGMRPGWMLYREARPKHPEWRHLRLLRTGDGHGKGNRSFWIGYSATEKRLRRDRYAQELRERYPEIHAWICKKYKLKDA